MMIVISGTISRGRTPFSGWWIAPDSCDCSARLKLQRVDRGTVDFIREFEFAARWRPCRDHEEDCGNGEVDGAKNGRGGNRAPDLDQREIG